TNADPDPIDFPIAGNDDAIKSIRVLLKELVDAGINAKQSVTQDMIETALDEERNHKVATYTTAEDEKKVDK
ncbi:MAG: 30S ribosomal protein S2, partial [Candidatus Zixiibacteriota bacterium]